MPANPAAGISGSCVFWFDRSVAAAESNLAIGLFTAWR
jgi:hypothetical protein